MSSYFDALAAGRIVEYHPVGISSWDDERYGDRPDASDYADAEAEFLADSDDDCTCRTYATPSGTGDGYGGSFTDTSGCLVHDPDSAFIVLDLDVPGSIGMFHDYGSMCGCSACTGDS